jgi:ankyrin repeat protein
MSIAACFHGHSSTVEVLLKRKANIDQAGDKGETPLIAACLHGQSSTVEVLLAHGADATQALDDGRTALDEEDNDSGSLILTINDHHARNVIMCIPDGDSLFRDTYVTTLADH